MRPTILHLVGLPALALTALASAQQAQTTHVVTQVNLAFDPVDLTIQLGDTVRWEWTGGFHTVTSGTDGTVDGDELFHSLLDDATPVYEVVFDEALIAKQAPAGGVYDYFCAPHIQFDMVGTIRVEGVSLVGDTDSVSVFTGGDQVLSLDAGPARAFEPYLVLGSSSGTTPGLPLGALSLPLNPDSYTNAALSLAGSAPFLGFVGALDANGTGTATFSLPPALGPGFLGLELHHAFVAFDLLGGTGPTFVSNPVEVNLGF